ncbi:hypothetical protein HYV84_01930 [Candidatus Woesearchaeota archaeon]|nr:hypothetical protein [Candidatus Woesearchaeota archaeon]
MAYIGRSVGVGNVDSLYFSFFGLASKSARYRTFRRNTTENRVEIVPAGKALEPIRRNPDWLLDYTLNHYACLSGFHTGEGVPIVVSANGNMGKYLQAQLTHRRWKIADCLDRTLRTLVPQERGDPRLVAVCNGAETHFGTFSVDDEEPRISKFSGPSNSQLKYVTLTDPGNIQTISIQRISNPDDLAKILYYQIYGHNPEFGIGAAVCLKSEGQFNLGFFFDPNVQG